MPTTIGSLIRQATRKPGERLNILSWPTHESYQSNLCNVNADFYLWRAPNLKDWVWKYRQLPRNHHLLDPNKGDDQIPKNIDLDLILAQNVAAHYPLAYKLSRSLQIPLIVLTHTLPPNDNPVYLQQVKSLRGDINIFISNFSREKWGWSEEEAVVIEHGLNTDLFAPNPRKVRQKHILSVVNDWKNRDYFCGYNLWEKVIKGLPYKVLGDNGELSQAAKSLTDLIDHYQKSAIFLNTSLVSPIPSSMLEAASVGCAIVSTCNSAIPHMFTHGKDAFLSNDPAALRVYLNQLLCDENLCKRMGEAARKTVMEKYNLGRFTKDWNNVLNNAVIFRGVQ
jgi:glycosyltransferase involved in cell wall biosynthesis